MRMVNGRYRLDEQVGSGGMAVVWRGYDLLLQRTVAVKTLPTADQRARERLQTEAQAVARLNHVHIAAIYDIGEYPGEETDDPDRTIPYLVMEFVRGGTLQQRLAAEGRLPWRAVARIGAQVAAALGAAHELGIVHRDVKPANVMLGPIGVKMVDFGISAAIGQSPDVLLGTPAYMAPEHLSGGQATAAGDVYGLGLLLYRCLTGMLPWPTTDAVETVRVRHRTPAVELPATPGIPDDLVDLCNRCLDELPEARPSSAFLARAFAGAATLRPSFPAPPPHDQEATQPLPLAIGQPLVSVTHARRIRTAWSLGTLAALAAAAAIAVSPLPARLLSHPAGAPATAPLPADTGACLQGLGAGTVRVNGRLIACEAPPAPASVTPGTTRPSQPVARPRTDPPSTGAPPSPVVTLPAAHEPARPPRSPAPPHSPTPTPDRAPSSPADSTAPAVSADPTPSG